MIFTQLCLLCGTETNQGFCQYCSSTLPFNKTCCSRCALPITTAQTLCGECLKHPPSFDRSLSPFLYQTPISLLIKSLKHQGQLTNARLLANLFSKQFPLPPNIDMIVPIPLQPKRIQLRGFNQSSELARQLSKTYNIPWKSNILFRYNDKHQQQGADRKTRLTNIKQAFYVKQPLRSNQQRIAIIDDVMTTGATANDAARALKDQGASHVEVWAISRTPKQKSRNP